MADQDNQANSTSEQGTTFGSRYVLLSKIGSGGMGAVHKANDNVLRKTVAVKFLLPNAHAEAMIRFHQEARMAARLSHPNILTVFDFGQNENGELYLIMDFLDGESLHDFLNRTKRVTDLNQAVSIFLQIGAGLAHAHEQGILHRDIKPSNIMLVQDDRGYLHVKIVDFGLAKVEGAEQSLTTTGMRVGSPLYMSPEQARGETIDHRSDLYSFGCLMYKALTGSVPFHGDSYIQTLSKHTSEPAKNINDVDLSEVSGASRGARTNETDHNHLEFPTVLADIVARLLEKDPADRFHTAVEVMEALSAIDPVSLKKAPVAEVDEAVPAVTISSAGLKMRILRLPTYIKLAGCLATLLCMAFAAYSASHYVINHHVARDVKIREEPKFNQRIFLQESELAMLFDGKFWIRAQDMTDDELPSLRKYKKHSRVCMSTSKVTGNKNFSVLKKLGVEELDVAYTGVTDDAMPEILKLQKLRRLRLDGDKVTDDGIKQLSELPALTDLHLCNTPITDRSLEYIAGFPGIVAIDVSKCPLITDAGIKSLSSARHLRRLYAIDCPGVQPKTLERLKASKGRGFRLEMSESADTKEMTQIGHLKDGWSAWFRYDELRVNKREGGDFPLHAAVIKYQESMQDPEFQKFWQDPLKWQRMDISKIKNRHIVEALKDPSLRMFFKDPKARKQLQQQSTWDKTTSVEKDISAVIFGTDASKQK